MPIFADKKRALLVALIGIALYHALFMLRAVDDNRLAPWGWLMGEGDEWRVLLIASIGMFAALGASGLHMPPARALAAVAVVSSALLWHTPETIVDTARYVMQAKYLELNGIGAFVRDWGSPELEAWTDLPLIPFMYGMLFRLFGEHRLLVQCLNAGFFGGTVWLACAMGRRLWDEPIGRAAGLMLLSMPVLYAQAPLMLVDMGTMFFVTLAAFMSVEARGGALWTSATGTAIALAALCKYSAWPMLSIIAVIWAVRPNKRAGAIAASLGVALAAVALWYKADAVMAQVALLREYQGPGLRRWGESFISTFFFQAHPFVTILALMSIGVALRRRDAKFLIIVWLALLAAAFDIRRSRYLMPMLPMLALMAGYGLSAIKDTAARRTAALGAALCSLGLVMTFYMPLLERYDTVNLKTAAEVMDRMPGDRVRLITLPQSESDVNPAMAAPLMDLYLSKPLTYHYSPARAITDEQLAVSPLRFTWSYRNPPYYEGAEAPIIAIVSDGDVPEATLPEGFRIKKEFLVTTGNFTYRPLVRIYTR